MTLNVFPTSCVAPLKKNYNNYQVVSVVTIIYEVEREKRNKNLGNCKAKSKRNGYKV